MKAPLVSILLPTHNRAETLSLALRSLLAQDMPDTEILVVGDGCTDDTAAVVAAVEDPRIRWYDLPKAPNFGYANRNFALRDARGTYVAMAAHDDLWLPDHLSRLIKAIEGTQADVAFSRPLWVEPDDTIIPFPVDLRDPRQAAFFERCNLFPAACILYRRACHDDVGYLDEGRPHSSDWDLIQRIMRLRPGHLGQIRAPTALHFRAIWRTDSNAMPEITTRLAAIARAAPWWPLRGFVQTPQGLLQQAVYFRAITTDPDRFAMRLRTACDAAIDRAAWTLIQPPLLRAEAPMAERSFSATLLHGSAGEDDLR
jgi:glycosyltransferase involved in cell wall biosynthesis